MLKKKNIQQIFLTLLTTLFNDYEIDTSDKAKIFDSLLNGLKTLNALLDNEFIFFDETLNKKECKQNLKYLNFLFSLLSHSYSLIKTDIPAGIETEFKTEYEKIIDHFNSEYAVLRFGLNRNKTEYFKNGNEAVNHLKEFLNV
jgi:hypothetical protein